MSGRHRFFTIMVAVFLATATQTFAQGRQAGTVRGTTYDSTRLALPGVTITLKSVALQGERVSVSGATGAFEFLGLRPVSTTSSLCWMGSTQSPTLRECHSEELSASTWRWSQASWQSRYR